MDSTRQQPDCTLVDWRIMEAEDGACHLVGLSLETRKGRVSSAIALFDPLRRLVVTSSGRLYAIEGPPGTEWVAERVWAVWAKANGVPEYRDRTSHFCVEIGDATDH